MISLKGLLICILFFSFGLAHSQSPDSTNIFNTRTYTISYFGNMLVKPGIKFGANIRLSEKHIVKNKTKKNGKIIDKSRTKQFLLEGDIGFFWHPKSHVGMFNYYELIYKNIKTKKRRFSIIGIGPGIYRSVYPETYEVDNNGNVNKIPFAGRTYFAPVLIFGTGYIKKDRSFQSWHINTVLIFLFDYNSGIVPLLNFEIGFTFDFRKK